MSTEKVCSQCRLSLPLDAFYARKLSPDGLMPCCKQCHLANTNARYYRNRVLKGRAKSKFANHEYFSLIDSPLKAYVLGVLAADGNVLTKYNRVTLELAEKDAALMQLICSQLTSGKTWKRRERNGRGYLVLTVFSSRMVADLAEYGIVDAKSKSLVWPQALPPHYARPFILGYFDGDGFITSSIYKNKNGKVIRYDYLGIVSGSQAFLCSLVDIIERETGAHMAGPWQKGSSGCYLIRACGRAARSINQWLHSDGSGLERKYLS